MRLQQRVHSFIVEKHCLLLLKLGQVLARGIAANLAVGSVGNGRLVENRVEAARFDALLLAPVLRKDVMNIELALLPIARVQIPDRAFEEPIDRAVSLNEHVNCLVRGAGA